MATVLGNNPYIERRTGERRRIAIPPGLTALTRGGMEGFRVSWGGGMSATKRASRSCRTTSPGRSKGRVIAAVPTSANTVWSFRFASAM